MRALLLAGLVLSACGEAEPPASVPPLPTPIASGAALADASHGAVVYVPAYSHVYAGDRQQRVNLTVTLSVRNADPASPLTVASVQYYDSEGRPLRSYLDAPRPLAPLASADFVVDESDTSGGSGASFLVEWTAEQAVAAPVVEAVMIHTAGQQGISFVTEGRVVAVPDSL